MTGLGGTDHQQSLRWIPSRALALKIAFSYAMLGAAWIFLSGRVLHFLVQNPELLEICENIKGWFFIGITALLLWVALDRYFHRARQTVAELQESEARLQVLGDNIPETYVFQYTQETNGTPRFTYASAGMERVHGVPVAMILKDAGMLLGQLDASQRAALSEATAESARNMADFRMEFRTARPDGDTRVIHVRSKPRRNTEGRILWDGVGVDITERKRAETSLAAKEQNLRMFIEHAPVALALLDRDMRYIDFSKRWLSDYRLEGRDLTGLSHYEVFPEIPEALKEINRRALGGKPSRGENDRFERADGTVQWLRWEVLPWHDPQGSIAGVLIFSEDVTKQKQMEETLRKSEERYRTLVETSGDWVWEVDKDVRYTYASARVQDILGYAPEEILGRSPFDFMPEDEAGRVRDVFSEIAEERRPFANLLNVNLHKGGRRVVLETTGMPIFAPDGTLIGYRGMDHDITERKRLEEEQSLIENQLRQAQKMEAIGRLAGGVAHDFNNMLGVIIGNTDMAMLELEKSHPLYADLEGIHRAAERSADLTRQLLAFARRQIVSPRIIDLNETVGGMLKMLRRLIGEDIDLAWLPGREVPPVNMDPAQVDQLLANLCVNARDAIDGIGKVTIETNAVSFDAEYCANNPGFIPGAYVMLAVSDSGCGMDSETLEKIFEPFFTTKEQGKGTGLGLSTVYGIVRQNQGFVHVYSEPGQGTTFKVYLPRHQGELERVEQSPVQPVARGQETILIVEDESIMLNLITRVLANQGYTVLAAGTPSEAIRQAEMHAGEIDLLVTDIVLPEMNGRVLSDMLLDRFPKMKRLFMSGYTPNVIAHHGVLDAGVHFIQKPFTVRAIAAKVREALGD